MNSNNFFYLIINMEMPTIIIKNGIPAPKAQPIN